MIWDGRYRDLYIAESETEPLIRMAMLYGYRLQVDVVEGGVVKIKALCSLLKVIGEARSNRVEESI